VLIHYYIVRSDNMKRPAAKTHENDLEEPEHRLYEAIVALSSIDEAKRFFEDLCTPTERQAMADRWHVVGPIQEGLPYRKIYEQTGVSVTTVGRVARSLMLGSGGYSLIYDRIKRKYHATKRKTDPRDPEKRPVER
ncbi:MAG: YerC/YecD family TrpR-related protein, partial [Candidatus Berkiellales bacterium]